MLFLHNIQKRIWHAFGHWRGQLKSVKVCVFTTHGHYFKLWPIPLGLYIDNMDPICFTDRYAWQKLHNSIAFEIMK